MISKLRYHLTAKKTVLSLLLLLLFAILLSVVIPQRFSTPAAEFNKWQQAHQDWLPTLDQLGLHHIFTTTGFALLLFLFLISLGIATQEQLKIAFRRTFGQPQSAKAELETYLDKETLTRIMHDNGYSGVRQSKENILRYRKHPWGHWGIFFLHLGILSTIIGSLIFTVDTKRVAIRLIEGETHLPSDPWLYEELGIFADNFTLSEAVYLDKVTPEFWPQGGVKNVISEVRFIPPHGDAVKASFDMHNILSYDNFRVYQESVFGTAFYVWLTDDAGFKNGVVIDITTPVMPDKPSYGNFNFPEIPYAIKAKYYADADKKSLVGDNPLLVLRLMELNTVIGELALTKGKMGRLGQYNAELVHIARWTNFTFMTTPGITAVFFGFFIFSLGGLLYYFTIPREYLCQRCDNGYRITWKCARFREHYQEEYHSIVNKLRETETP